MLSDQEGKGAQDWAPYLFLPSVRDTYYYYPFYNRQDRGLEK